MYISISAVDKHSAESFMKMLLTLSMSREFDYDAAYKRNFSLWFSEGEPFIKRFKLSLPLFKRAQAGILSGVDCNTDDAFHQVILSVFDAVQEKHAEVKAELDLRREDVSFITDCRLFYTKNSASARARLHKNASRFGESDISSMFVTEHDDIADEKAKLRALVKKYTKKEGYELPVDLLQEWQAHAKKTGKKLKDHEEYLALRKPINAVLKTRLQALIRSSQKPMLLVSTVREALNAENIVHSIPEGFVGYINDAGKYFTLGKLEMKQAPRGEVIMNDTYDPDSDNMYVCTFKAPGSPKFSRAYTLKYAGESKVEKFEVVGQTIPMLAALRTRWRQDLDDVTLPVGVYSTLVEFVDETSSRVSSDKAESHGNRTYGATTMQLRHVKITPTQLIVSYQGKSSGDQYHVIDYKGNRAKTRLVANFKALMKGKGPEDKVFTLNGKGVRGSAVNRYMRSIGFPQKFTIHKFRTRTGMLMAAELLAQSPFKKGGAWKEADVTSWVEEQMLKIGTQLGHNSNGKVTSATAIQNYIEPSILYDFFNKLGLRVPSKIQKAIDSIKG
jgi:DNA topoisomerase IB